METQIWFGPIMLDRLHCRLQGPLGTQRIDQKACDVLTLLIENRGRAVPREEILSRVWPDRIVSESGVPVHVRACRAAFERVGCGQDAIVTQKAPLRYQFCLEPTAPPAALAASPAGQPLSADDNGVSAPHHEITFNEPRRESAQPAPRTGFLRRNLAPIAAAMLVCVLAASGLAVVLTSGHAPPPLSIVVKPFRNLSTDREKDYLADAITDDLTSELGHVPYSTVIARSTAEAVKDKTPQEIGRKLNVRYVLEGTLRPEDGQYHVTAGLVDTGTGAEVWSANFDRPFDRVSALRQDIVSNVRSPLKMRLDDLASTVALRENPNNLSALDCFLRARSILDHRQDLSSFKEAQGLLERAVEIEPDSAEANAELGWILLRKVTSFDDPDDVQDRARATRAIDAALQHSPLNEKARADKAFLDFINDDCGSATATASQILDTYPNFIEARGILGMCAIADARLDVAVAVYSGMIRLDPEGPRVTRWHLPLGTSLLVEEKPGEAEEHLARCLVHDEPVSDMSEAEQCAFMHIAALSELGRHDEAEAEYKSYAERYQGRTVWRLASYFAPSWRNLPGFRLLRQGLKDAGMPEYANEHEVFPGTIDSCGPGDFAPVPEKLRGGRTVYANDLPALLSAAKRPLLIDVGRKVISIAADEKAYKDTAAVETPEEFAQETARRFAAARTDGLIVVFGDGVRGCSAFSAAKTLVTTGFTNVAWFRGGEEAWAAAYRGDANEAVPQPR